MCISYLQPYGGKKNERPTKYTKKKKYTLPTNA